MATKDKDAPKRCTAKEEAFCLKYIELRQKTAAYKLVYNHTGGDQVARNQACRVFKRPHVTARVIELLEDEKLGAFETVHTIAAQLDEDRAMARELGQASAAVSSTVHKAKMLGIYQEQSKVEHAISPDTVWTVNIVRPDAKS